MDARKTLLTRFFEALDRQDIEGVLAYLHPDVDFPDQIEGGRLVGKAAVGAYWTEAFKIIRASGIPTTFRELEGDDLIVTVHHHVTNLEGGLWHDGPVTYRVAFQDGLIQRMDHLSDG